MSHIYNWEYCQATSDSILNSGLAKLKSARSQDNANNVSNAPGNYFFSYNDIPMYVGEAGNLLNRIKQQLNLKRSTFYKNYLKNKDKFNFGNNLGIEDFCFQLMKVNISRKELEEFGIVNLPTLLNKFQKGKRSIYNKDPNIIIWDDIQNNYSSIISDGASLVLNQKPSDWFNASTPIGAGLYLVQNSNQEFIYVGETSNVYDRYTTHSSNTYFSAFRRNLGTDVLGFYLKEKNGKKRYFEDHENIEIDNYIKCCKIFIVRVNFGRYELEEHLIKTLNPLLNRKSKKK